MNLNIINDEDLNFKSSIIATYEEKKDIYYWSLSLLTNKFSYKEKEFQVLIQYSFCPVIKNWQELNELVKNNIHFAYSYNNDVLSYNYMDNENVFFDSPKGQIYNSFINISERVKNTFMVKIEGKINLFHSFTEPYSNEDKEYEINIEINERIPFEFFQLYINTDSKNEVNKIANEYLDLKFFDKPIFESNLRNEFRIIFKPTY